MSELSQHFKAEAEKKLQADERLAMMPPANYVIIWNDKWSQFGWKELLGYDVYFGEIVDAPRSYRIVPKSSDPKRYTSYPHDVIEQVRLIGRLYQSGDSIGVADAEGELLKTLLKDICGIELGDKLHPLD